MRSTEQHPVVTRGRVLLIALLAAFVWLMLTIFGSSSPAAAEDSADSGSLLDTITSTVNEISPVPAVTTPVSSAIKQVVEPLEPAVQPVTQQAAVTPVTRTAQATLTATTKVVDEVVEPVLEQPLVAGTVQLLDGVAEESIDALTLSIDHASSTFGEPASSAIAVIEPEPAVVGSTVAAPDSWAPRVPAAGSLSLPDSPASPVAPAPAPRSTPSSALGQGSGAPSLLAAISPAGGSAVVAGASAGWVNFAVPSSPTFDSDTSPD